MTLASTTVKKSYDGDDSTVAFPTTFIFWDIADIEVILTNILGVEQPPWVEGTHYDLTGGDGELGTVTVKTTPTDYTPATGEKLLIRSNRDDKQSTAFPLGGSFPSVLSEQANDQQVRLIQQRTEELGRVLSVKKTSALEGIEVPDPVTGQILIGNAAGDGYDNAEPLEGSVILDEDDMASNSPTQAVSQQSLVSWIAGGAVADVPGYSNTANNTNVGAGYQVFATSPTANGNTAFGYKAGTAIESTGANNTVVGHLAALALDFGSENVALGYSSLWGDIGSRNTALGSRSGRGITGSDNIAIGYKTLETTNTVAWNVAIGTEAGISATSGNLNTYVGFHTGHDMTTGGNNTLVGSEAGKAASPSGSLTTESNQIVLGNDAVTNAHIKVAWTVSSDARDKTDIEDYNHGLDYVSLLRPVTYVWDNRSNYANGIPDGSLKVNTAQLGFLAQDLQVIEDILGITESYIVDESNPSKLGFNETKLIPILVNAIKELSARIEALEGKN